MNTFSINIETQEVVSVDIEISMYNYIPKVLLNKIMPRPGFLNKTYILFKLKFVICKPFTLEDVSHKLLYLNSLLIASTHA